MKRTFLVLVTAAAICLALTGLRVTVLERLSQPAGPSVAPRPVEDGQPPRAEPPVERIARTPDGLREGSAARTARLEPPAMIWGAPPRRTPF